LIPILRSLALDKPLLSKALAALLVLTSFAACQTNKEPSGRWAEGMVKSPSDRVLWQVSRLSLRKMRFPSAGALDPASGKLKSGWKTQLHPFQGEGYRERAEVEIVPIEKGSWAVRTRVAKQVNEALVSPLDPSRAEWEWVSDDPNSAKILLTHITSLMEPEMEFVKQKDALDELNKRADK